MKDRARMLGGWLPWILVPTAVLIFFGANAHLVYVAFESQPECVQHLKSTDGAGRYRAAKSAC